MPFKGNGYDHRKDFFVAILLHINCNDYSSVEGVWLLFLLFMLVALAINNLVMPAALTLQ